MSDEYFGTDGQPGESTPADTAPAVDTNVSETTAFTDNAQSQSAAPQAVNESFNAPVNTPQAEPQVINPAQSADNTAQNINNYENNNNNNGNNYNNVNNANNVNNVNYANNANRAGYVAPHVAAYAPYSQAYRSPEYKEEPLSLGEWALSLILLYIPVVGLIMTILWACGVGKNMSRTNFARANLIIRIVAFVLVVLFAVVCVFTAAALGYRFYLPF